MIERHTCRAKQPCKIGPTAADTQPHHRQQRERGRIRQHDRCHIEAPEGDRRSADADLQIVLTIDHGVFGIVGNRPENVGGQHQPGGQRNRSLQSRKGHRNAEAEGDAEIGLGQREKPLGKGVARRQECRHSRQRPGQAIHRQHQHQRHQRQGHKQPHRLIRADQACGQRPVASSLDMTIEIAVGPVVDRTARRSHQQRTDAECDEFVERRGAVGSDEKRPERGPQEQQCSDRTMQSQQASIKRPARGRRLDGRHGRVAQGHRSIRERRGRPSGRRQPSFGLAIRRCL